MARSNVARAVVDPIGSADASAPKPIQETLASDVAALRAELAVERAARLELALRVAVLERGHTGPHDRAILEAIARSSQGEWFRSSDLLRHARVDASLQAVFEAACVSTRDDLGILLRRLKGVRFGFAVARRGRQWRVTHATHDVSSLPEALPSEL